MKKERIIELMEKGYITHVDSADVLASIPENELMEKGYITQVGIFDGDDDTIEVLEQEDVEDVVDTPTPTEVVDDEEPVVDDEEPVVGEGEEE